MIQGSLVESSVNCAESKNPGGTLVWLKGHVAAAGTGLGSSLPCWGTSESGGASLTLSFLLREWKCLDQLLEHIGPFLCGNRGSPGRHS